MLSRRVLPARYVLNDKVEEEGRREKARLCTGGHCDPDLVDLVEHGLLASPTCSTMARYWALQLMASIERRC